MEFCEKCGGIIIVQEKKAACTKCKAKLKKIPKIELSEKVEKKESIPVIKEGSETIEPIITMDCPKCENKKAYFWTLQTRATDEAETKFYKCTKCGYTWRKYR
ncbi:MAG: transcription factor S [Candidatus Pacearchaeota archaeon]|nr:transcription factor S [Candidatus Pacearchaeota archaeon]